MSRGQIEELIASIQPTKSELQNKSYASFAKKGKLFETLETNRAAQVPLRPLMDQV